MPLLTPYVASRSTDKGMPESTLTVEFTANGPRLTYRNPRPEDRDKHGNLWVRVEESPDPGHVQYDSLHSTRQRTCMEHLLCQICAQPADRNKDGWLFIDWQREDSPPTWPEKSLTTMPPLCTEHARISLRQCPFLRRGEHVLLRVRKPHLYGVSGTLYRLTTTGWISTENGQLSPYSKPRHPGMLAFLLLRQLRGVKVAELP
ncbi:hypothetical protein OG413_06070 [Streptomyces sp. NBC_01433]|uniref:hypothetical protein n=1 Tax=Streptomyces sp. NBC_01433 TaxID=2903864 RepID=UPI0022513DC8|nr:hypothetical protein [Streptomyces sp. NBC_01433]MCX4674895.1 hypothetical protein [Streptomyces sp. NBC_01433]